ncbi:hypothetical protein [Pararhizobium sp. O133]
MRDHDNVSWMLSAIRMNQFVGDGSDAAEMTPFLHARPTEM